MKSWRFQIPAGICFYSRLRSTVTIFPQALRSCQKTESSTKHLLWAAAERQTLTQCPNPAQLALGGTLKQIIQLPASHTVFVSHFVSRIKVPPHLLYLKWHTGISAYVSDWIRHKKRPRPLFSWKYCQAVLGNLL